MLAPLRVGDRVRRVTTIGDITCKQGRSGELWFVAVNHEYATERGMAVRERHDIVYRQAAGPDAGAPAQAQTRRPRRATRRAWAVATSPTLLFRYSAITFNGHRIHYDLPYATGVEGYDGLVVHGPIQATLLLNLAASEAGAPPRIFDYRGVAPAIAGRELHVCVGEDGALWTQGADGTVHMDASVRG
jgi:3-methylfumaryl-CoA hydratase